MTTIYIGKGKKDKISKGDIVGFLCKKGQLGKDDIGRIDVNDRYAYAAISRGKLKQVLQLTKGEKIKGVRTVVEPVRWWRSDNLQVNRAYFVNLCSIICLCEINIVISHRKQVTRQLV